MTVTLGRALQLLAAAGVMLVISGGPGTASAASSRPLSAAQAGVITTVAGGPGGPAAGRTVAVNGPCGVTSDREGLYFTESGNDVVRRLNLRSGALGTVAGIGPTRGPRSLDQPCAVTTGRAGNLIFADTGNNVVRVIAARNGVYYGTRMRAGRSYVVGGSSFSAPDALGVDGHGNLLVTSQTTQGHGSAGTAVVSVLAGATGTFYGQQMVPGRVYPLAGQGCPGQSSGGCRPGLGGDDGPALQATFGQALWGVATDRSENVVIADSGDNRVRVIAASTGVFYGVTMTAGDIYSIAGGGTGGLGDGGPASQSTLSSPRGLVVDSAGNLVLADWGNPLQYRSDTDRIRVVAARTGRFYGQKMTAGHIYTIAGNGRTSYSGDGGPATHAELSPFVPVVMNGPRGQAVDPAGLAVSRDGNIVVADSANFVIRVIAARTGVFYGRKMTARHIYTVAGTGTAGFSGDGRPAIRAQLEYPGGVAVDHAGNILVSDIYDSRIRVIAASAGRFYGRPMTAGDIYTFAGGGSRQADRIPATSEALAPEGLAVDRNGNVLVAESRRVRVVAARTGTFYRQRMTEGDIYTLKPNSAAMTADAVAVDHAGNVVIASIGYSQIDVIAVRAGRFYGITMKPGRFYPVAGRASSPGFSGDGGPAEDATLNSPSGVAVDAAGNLLFADSDNNRIRVVAERSGTFYGVKMTVGDIYTIAGSGKPCQFGGCGGFSGYGGRATSAGLSTPCGIAAYGTDLLVLDNQNNRVREVSG